MGLRSINAGCAAVPEACHYLYDVSSGHAALQMFPLPQQSCTDERLMEMVGGRSGSPGEQGSGRKLAAMVTIKTG